MKKRLTFNDLEFNQQRFDPASMQAVLELGNNLSISVVYGPGKYSDITENTYEVAIFHDGAFLPLQAYDDVIGWQTKEQITSLMLEAQENSSVLIQEKLAAKEEYRRDMELN